MPEMEISKYLVAKLHEIRNQPSKIAACRTLGTSEFDPFLAAIWKESVLRELAVGLLTLLRNIQTDQPENFDYLEGRLNKLLGKEF